MVQQVKKDIAGTYINGVEAHEASSRGAHKLQGRALSWREQTDFQKVNDRVGK